MSRSGYMILCGAGAAFGSLVAVSILAKAEGKPAIAPISASSHWMWGDAKAPRAEADFAHTGVGAATNVAAGLFWGALFGAHLHRARSGPREIVRDGMVLGAMAGLLDYGLLPRRLSPGWELALSGRSVVLSMAAMGGGAVAGGLVAHALDPDTIGP